MSAKIELHNVDCMEYMSKLQNNAFDLILTDPPYLFNKSPGKPYADRKQCKTKSEFANSNLYSYDGDVMRKMSSFTEIDLIEFLNKTLRLMNKYNAYYFCSESQIPFYFNWANKNNLMVSVLIWEKPLSIINKNRFSQNIEFILRVYNYGTALKKVNENKCYNRVKKYNSPNKKIHPTQKPTALIGEILKVTRPKKIFDPFAGSGSIALASDILGFNYVGCEIDTDYFNSAKKRLQQHQSQLRIPMQ